MRLRLPAAPATLPDHTAWELPQNRLNQGNTPHCVPPETPVVMADGSERHIADIRAGEFVLSHLGNPCMVEATFAHRFDGDLVAIRTRGAPAPAFATLEHPFLASEVGFDRSRKDHTARTIITNTAWVEAGRLGVKAATTYAGHLLHRPLALPVGVEAFELPGWGHVSLGQDVAWLFGLYASEGWTRAERGEFALALGGHEAHFAERAAAAIERAFNVPARLQYRTAQNVIVVRAGSVPLAKAFRAAFGSGAANKRIPTFCWSWHRMHLHELLTGALDGDGYRRQARREATYVTISPTLAYDIHRLATVLGENATVTQRPARQNRRPAWDVRIYPTTKLRVSHEGSAMAPIEALTAEPYSGLVHDLQIEEDHSFIAGGYAVHNCVGFAWMHWAGNSPVRTLTTNDDGHALYDACKLIDGYPGDGTWVRVALKVLQDRGRIARYLWAETVDDIRQWVLLNGPVVVGTPWFEGMSNPVNGIMRPTGALQGGHAWEIWEADATHATMLNSWGGWWSVNGTAKIMWADLATLFANGQSEGVAAEETGTEPPEPAPDDPYEVRLAAVERWIAGHRV